MSNSGTELQCATASFVLFFAQMLKKVWSVFGKISSTNFLDVHDGYGKRRPFVPYNNHLKGRIYETGRRQREIATELGISEWQMTAIVTGRTVVSNTMKKRLAKILGCNVPDIFPIKKEKPCVVN
jgi:DNA-binding XRE family transcriptional regulator